MQVASLSWLSLLAAPAASLFRWCVRDSAVSAFDIESVPEQCIDINDKKEGAGDRRALKLPHGSSCRREET